MIEPINRRTDYLFFVGDSVPLQSADHFFSPLQYLQGILGDLLAFFIQSPVNFHDTWQND